MNALHLFRARHQRAAPLDRPPYEALDCPLEVPDCDDLAWLDTPLLIVAIAFVGLVTWLVLG